MKKMTVCCWWLAITCINGISDIKFPFPTGKTIVPGMEVPITAPELVLPFIRKPPVIDGIIYEEEWQDASRNIGLMKTASRLETQETLFWVCCDLTNLYLAVKTAVLPRPPGNMPAKPAEDAEGKLGKEDTVEFWINPHRQYYPVNLGKTTGDLRFFKIRLDSSGRVTSTAFDPSDMPWKEAKLSHSDWRAELKSAQRVTNGWWEVETAIPLASIGVEQEDINRPWGLRVVRNWNLPKRKWSTDWVPAYSKGYECQSTMGVVRWDTGAPVVRMLSLQKAGGKKVEVALELRNITERNQEVAVETSNHGVTNAAKVVQQTVKLQPGKQEVLKVEGDIEGDECETMIRATWQGKVIYFRNFIWALNKQEILWPKEEEDYRKAPEFDFGYYPSYNKIKGRVRITNLEGKEKVKGAKMFVRAGAGKGEVLAEGVFPGFQDGESELVLEIPELAEGNYTAEMRLSGDGIAVEPVIKAFVRKKFEWEGNRIGFTDKIIPPFTPLEVKEERWGWLGDNEIRCVLRQYRLSEIGLLDQVLSENRPLLAEPIRIEVESKGVSYKAKPVAEMEFTKKGEAEVQYQSAWKAGPITGRLTGSVEMDGMLKLELVLNQAGNDPIGRIDLVIPMRKDVASLMHVSNDLRAYRYGGYIPDGQGVVWGSRQTISKNKDRFIVGTFVPYIWIGNELQGICWFADSDRDWLVDDDKSTHEIIREGDNVLLVVHLVTRPEALKRERRIVFGLQATPTKPMPESPKPWRKWVINDANLVITDTNDAFYIFMTWPLWVKSTSSSVYPIGRDSSVFEMMGAARKTGAIDTNTFARWYEQCDPDDRGRQCAETFHWGARLAVDSNVNAVIIYNNSRGVSFYEEEFLTFQDEWLKFAYTRREWPKANAAFDGKIYPPYANYVYWGDRGSGILYEVIPVKSYQDYYLWWLKKMIAANAADGIYFDDTFIIANQNMISGGAYKGDDGKLRPSYDLFAMREYLKRVQIMCVQLGKPWLNIAHMSSAQFVPITTWAAINLDGEWSDGWSIPILDFQDRFCRGEGEGEYDPGAGFRRGLGKLRFSRDFFRAETIGLQSGCVPLILDYLHSQDFSNIPVTEVDRITRTELGSALVHEIKIYTTGHSNKSIISRVQRLMYEFGYGEPDCKVDTYWGKDFPASITGVEAEGLLLERRGRTLLVVTDFGNGGDCHVRLDRRQLGLEQDQVFYDMESGAMLDGEDAGGCRFKLKKHDFRIIASEGLARKGQRMPEEDRRSTLLKAVCSKDPDSITLLKNSLEDTNALNRRIAAQGLVALGDAGGMEGMLKHKEAEIRVIGLEGLQKMNAIKWEHLKAAIQDQDLYVRIKVLDILSSMPDSNPEKQQLLDQILADEAIAMIRKWQMREERLNKPLPVITVPRLKESAGGDPGKVDWGKAARLEKWSLVTGEPASHAVETRLLHDGKYLYVMLDGVVSDESRLVSDKQIFEGDDWEIFFSMERGRHPYRMLAVNPQGVSIGYNFETDKPGNWESGARIVTNIHKNHWVTMLAFPMEKLLPEGVKSGQKIYANFYRSMPSHDEWLAWSPNFARSFHILTRLGELDIE